MIIEVALAFKADFNKVDVGSGNALSLPAGQKVLIKSLRDSIQKGVHKLFVAIFKKGHSSFD